MIDREIADQARSLLQLVIVTLLEDEQGALLQTPSSEGFAPPPATLKRLGEDIAAIAGALEVIDRRAEPEALHEPR